jgi:hypothetical protein
MPQRADHEILDPFGISLSTVRITTLAPDITILCWVFPNLFYDLFYGETTNCPTTTEGSAS